MSGKGSLIKLLSIITSYLWLTPNEASIFY